MINEMNQIVTFPFYDRDVAHSSSYDVNTLKLMHFKIDIYLIVNTLKTEIFYCFVTYTPL